MTRATINFVERLSKLMFSTGFDESKSESAENEFKLSQEFDNSATFMFHVRRLFDMDASLPEAQYKHHCALKQIKQLNKQIEREALAGEQLQEARTKIEAFSAVAAEAESEAQAAKTMLANKMEIFGMQKLLDDIRLGHIQIEPWPQRINFQNFLDGDRRTEANLRSYLRGQAKCYCQQSGLNVRSPLCTYWLSLYGLSPHALGVMHTLANSLLIDFVPEPDQRIRNVQYLLTDFDPSGSYWGTDLADSEMSLLDMHYDFSQLHEESKTAGSMEPSGFMEVVNSLPTHTRMILHYSYLFFALSEAGRQMDPGAPQQVDENFNFTDDELKSFIKAMAKDTLYNRGQISPKNASQKTQKLEASEDVPDDVTVCTVSTAATEVKSYGSTEELSPRRGSGYHASPLFKQGMLRHKRTRRRSSVLAKNRGIDVVVPQSSLAHEGRCEHLNRVLDYLALKLCEYDCNSKDYKILLAKRHEVERVCASVEAGDISLDDAKQELEHNDTIRRRRNRFDCFHTPRTLRLIKAKDLAALEKIMPKKIRHMDFGEAKVVAEDVVVV